VVATPEGSTPNFYEAFAQLYLGQLVATHKCDIGDRRDGGIDQNTYHIKRYTLSSWTRVDEDLGIDRHAVHTFNKE
jgi:hypothetical protein